MSIAAEEFGRYQGKIRWNVIVESLPGDWEHYGYRIKLGGKAVGASREHPDGGLIGKYKKPADAAIADRKEAFRLAKEMIKQGVAKP